MILDIVIDTKIGGFAELFIEFLKIREIYFVKDSVSYPNLAAFFKAFALQNYD